MKHINQQLKTTKELEQKDMRHFNINFKMGDFDPDRTGIYLNTRFGIVDAKSEPILSIKEKLGFSDKESFLLFKIHIDTDETAEVVANRIKEYKIW